jgi:hypothetical protein
MADPHEAMSVPVPDGVERFWLEKGVLHVIDEASSQLPTDGWIRCSGDKLVDIAGKTGGTVVDHSNVAELVEQHMATLCDDCTTPPSEAGPPPQPAPQEPRDIAGENTCDRCGIALDEKQCPRCGWRQTASD